MRLVRVVEVIRNKKLTAVAADAIIASGNSGSLNAGSLDLKRSSCSCMMWDDFEK